MSERRYFVLPSAIDIEIEPSDAYPVVSDAVAEVRCFAHERNDYRLGPLFADASGKIHASRADLAILIEAQLASDLMGLASIESAYPLVELQLWRRADIDRAIAGRRAWGLIGQEAKLFGSVELLIERYARSASRNLEAVAFPPRIRDEWIDDRAKSYRLPMW